MLNRRHLLRTGAATVAAAMIARMPRAFAATYDLVIKGGRVIDPSLGLDAIRDVAIAKGKIAAVGEPTSPATPPRRSTRAASSWCRA